MIPTFILLNWILGLLSLGVIGTSIYMGREWYQRSWSWDAALQQSVLAPNWGFNEDTALFCGTLLLAGIALFGGSLVKLVLGLGTRKKGADELSPQAKTSPVEHHDILRPDGAVLHVNVYGPADGIPVVLTHGWGLHGDEWNYIKKELSDQFRLIIWDEPGLGKSTPPHNRDYSLENLAMNLNAVLALTRGKPAVLVGHSIGGMITLKFGGMFPEALGTSVSGFVLTHTTPVNPIRTTSGASILTAIEKPVLVPLMYLTIALDPVLRLMNWLSYRNGSAHLSTKQGSFAGTETWEQIEFVTRFNLSASPAILARGMLGMMKYDASAVLPTIGIPVLVIAGDKDSTTKPEASEMIRQGIPNSRLVTLSPAKHLGLLEHHSRYSETVREFVHTANGRIKTPLVTGSPAEVRQN